MKLTLIPSIILAVFASAMPTKQNDRFAVEALNLHNSNRAHYGAAPLTYDNELASGSAQHAAECHWGHSQLAGNDYGENIYTFSTSGGTIQQAVRWWMDEVTLYNYNDPVWSTATGHFTQIIWKSTTTLGCGIHVCDTGNPFGGSGQWTYIVCRYTPPGNYAGQFEENVGRRV